MKTSFLIAKLIVISFFIIIFPISPIRSAKEEKTWDYVILGSSIGTWGWTEYYGDYIENDLGVNIVSHSYYVPSQRASMLLHNPEQNCHPFRFKVATYSGLKLPPFRLKAATF